MTASTFLRRTAHAVGARLAWPHPPESYLDLLDPIAFAGPTRARIESLDRSVPGYVGVRLRAGAPISRTPGQFVTIGVRVDGVRHRRCFSPTDSGVDATAVDLTVRVHPGGVVGEYLERRASIGEIVHLAPAAGEFVLPPTLPDSLIFLAAGSGITPVASMVDALVRRGYPGRVALLHYVPGPDALPRCAIREDGAAGLPRFRARVVYTRAPAGGGDGVVAGRFTVEHLDALCPDRAGAQVFACGPAGFLDRVTDALGPDVRTESYRFATATPDPDSLGGTVTFARSGVTVDGDGRSILDLAEDAGLRPEFGCRMGICHGCTVVRRAGTTRDLRTGDLAGDPDVPVQICVSTTAGDVELDL